MNYLLAGEGAIDRSRHNWFQHQGGDTPDLNLEADVGFNEDFGVKYTVEGTSLVLTQDGGSY